jgi:hypothetical protein
MPPKPPCNGTNKTPSRGKKIGDGCGNAKLLPHGQTVWFCNKHIWQATAAERAEMAKWECDAGMAAGREVTPKPPNTPVKSEKALLSLNSTVFSDSATLPLHGRYWTPPCYWFYMLHYSLFMVNH